MEATEALAWFDKYLSAFAALGRGELNDPRLPLDCYAVPLLLTTDDAVVALMSEAEVGRRALAPDRRSARGRGTTAATP